MGTPHTGREIVAALKLASTWKTAVACGANDGILILSESFKQTIERNKDDSAGLAFIQRSDKGKISAGGGIEAYMRYEGWDLALALIMGGAGTPSLLDSTAYSNSYTLANTLAGIFGTFAILKKSDIVWEAPSWKPNSFKLSGEFNAPLKLSMDGTPNLIDLASSTNTAASMASVSYPDKGNRIIWNSDAYFRINDQSGDALDSDDGIYPASFDLSFSRPQDIDYTTGYDCDEPVDSDFPEPVLTLNFPRYNDANHAFFADWDAFTSKKMEIYFKGALIESTYYYEFKLTFPHLKVVDPEAAMSGPGKIPMSMSFDVFGCDSAPTGMTGITLPFQIDVQNTRSTSPLA